MTAAPEAPAPSRQRSRGLLVSLVLGGVLVVALVAAVALAVVQRGEALPGTTLGGVDVGGLGPAGVRAIADQVAAEQSARVTAVSAHDLDDQIVATDAGVSVDTAASADRALDAGRANPVSAVLNGIGGLFGLEREAGTAATLDEARLASEVERVRSAVDQTVRTGGFETSVEGQTATATLVPPLTGRTLDVAGTTAALRDALLAPPHDAPLELPVEVTEPGVTQQQAEAVTAAASRALAQPLVLTGGSDDTLTLTPAVIAPLLSAEPDPETGLELAVDESGLDDAVRYAGADIDRDRSKGRLISPAAKSLLTAKYTASWKPRKIKTSVEGGEDGVTLDVEASTQAAAEAIRSGSPSAELVAEVVPSSLSRKQLEAVDQVIGTFTTSYACCAPRARNIARMAELVDGTVVMPGKTFSLNEVAGERTTARGFYADGAIQNGKLVKEVGGGVSQFSTTLFNATWFAGVKRLEHQPHSVYISRYPPGREATLNWGTIDNRWRNDTDHPIVVRASTTSTSVTVSLYGHTGKRVVRSVTGSQQYRPGGGFRIAVTRTITDDGERTGKDTLTWTYKPPL